MKPFAILGAVAVVIGAIVLMVIVIRSSPTNVMDLDVGACFNADLEAEVLDSVEPVDCSDEHIAEVVAQGELNPARDRDYPADADLFAEADVACAGATNMVGDRFGIVPIPANAAAWEPLAGRYLCLAVPFGLVPTRGSAQPTADG